MTENDDPISKLYEFASSNGRVCPLPRKWHDFWMELCTNESDLMPPKPIILSGWWYSEDTDKAKRLKEQIAFASDAGMLERAGQFLRDLKSDEWHYNQNKGLAGSSLESL